MRKLIISLATGLAAILLLSSCSTPKEVNDLERYLNTLEVEYVVRDGVCKEFSSVVYSFVFDNSEHQVNCLVGYEIIYLGDKYNEDRYFYLVRDTTTKLYHFMNNRVVITPNGELKTHQEYFGGK